MADDSGFDSTSPPSCFATRPDAASTIRWPPTQESLEVVLKISGSSDSSGSPAEDVAPRSAQPWLQAATRGAEHRAANSGATTFAGCRPWAQSTQRKRGCRGHGALQKRAQQRRTMKAAEQKQDQRAAQRRSDSTNSRAVDRATQAQCRAMARGNSGGTVGSKSIDTGDGGGSGDSRHSC
jgi:hypothetical protein